MKFKVNKSLLPLKLVLFTYYGGKFAFIFIICIYFIVALHYFIAIIFVAAACILPYLTVHMRQIGITVEETAIIYAVLPIVGFLGPPTAGNHISLLTCPLQANCDF